MSNVERQRKFRAQRRRAAGFVLGRTRLAPPVPPLPLPTPTVCMMPSAPVPQLPLESRMRLIAA